MKLGERLQDLSKKGRFLPLDYVAGIYKDPNKNPTVTYYTLLKEGDRKSVV